MKLTLLPLAAEGRQARCSEGLEAVSVSSHIRSGLTDTAVGSGVEGHCDCWTLRELTLPICIGLLLDS